MLVATGWSPHAGNRHSLVPNSSRNPWFPSMRFRHFPSAWYVTTSPSGMLGHSSAKLARRRGGLTDIGGDHLPRCDPFKQRAPELMPLGGIRYSCGDRLAPVAVPTAS